MASILTTVRDLDRLRQIAVVLAKHGFGEVVRRTGIGSLLGPKKNDTIPPILGTAERIRLVLQELGPSFVKLGQIVSTRPDLIPEDIISELKRLQDEVPPVAWVEIEPHIEAELGAPIADLFESFSEAPLASASIGQAHLAQLKTASGIEDVVVKVQRPNIQRTIETDLDLLYWLARTVERSMPESRIYAPVKLVEQFDYAIRAELDFILEADNAARFRDNFEGHDAVRFPYVYREASSRRVITLERFTGKKVYDAVDGGASGETIAKQSVQVFMKQIFEDGFFHADPHPGNVFILGEPDTPVLGFIDLGLVGRLTPRLRDLVVDLMVASVRRDYGAMADALYAIGRPTKKIDRMAFEAEVATLSDKYLGKRLADMQLSALIRDLIRGATKFGLEIPPDFLMVGKCLMTVEGVGKEIYPDLDVFAEVQPFFLGLLRQRYSPERLTQDAMRSMVRLSSAANDLPVQMQDVLEDLRKGSLSIQVHEASVRSAADQLGRRLFSGLVIAGAMMSGAHLVGSGHPRTGALALLFALFWGLGHLWFLSSAERKRGRS
ncbi:MAG: AarF/ABC1/UbiB kinase family protein [Myxococcales bacterium]|nr:AarF/ABC1/UbiB kinase family protein [Myxococcales bacterium]